jgi:hypothetical protein
VVVAVYKEPVPVDLITLGYGEIEILGSCVYTPSDSRSVGLAVGSRWTSALVSSATLAEDRAMEQLARISGRG